MNASDQRVWRPWMGPLLLALAVVAAYQPIWHAGFIWDDDRHLTRPELLGGHGLWRIWTELGATQQYYPLVHSFFWLEHSIWGEAPLGYHLVNVALHLASALCLVRILQSLGLAWAWWAGALFALHPVEVESVAWVSELKNTLSGFFYLTAAWNYLRFDRTRRWQDYVVALLLFVAGLMSKTVIASLPVALLIVLWWQRGRLSMRRDIAPTAPFFAFGLASGLLTAWVERKLIHAEGSEFNFTSVERCLIAGRAFWFYLGKIVWPNPLSFIYPRWHVSQTVGWQYLFPIATLALFAVLIWFTRRSKGPLAAGMFFAATLFPALGFFNVFPFRYSFVADHFQYLATIGPLTLLAAMFHRWPKVFFLAIVLTYGILTWRQTRIYESAETLWVDTLAKDPGSVIARNNLSSILMMKGQLQEGIVLSESVLRDSSNNPTAHFNLGFAYFKQGKEREAVEQYKLSIAAQPNSPAADFQIAKVALQQKRFEEAIQYFSQGIQWLPDRAEPYCNLGYALLQVGRRDEAFAAYTQALALAPDYALAHNDLGNLLLQEHRVDEAIKHFQRAADLSPHFAEAHFNIAEVLASRGQLQEAISQYEFALMANPSLTVARQKLATFYSKVKRPGDAVAQLEAILMEEPNDVASRNRLAWILSTAPEAGLRNGTRALELMRPYAQSHNPGLLTTLAAAYAEAGQFDHALAAINESISKVGKDPGMLPYLFQQKAEYESHRPWRDIQR